MNNKSVERIELTDRQKKRIATIQEIAKDKGITVTITDNNRELIWKDANGKVVWQNPTSNYS